AAHPGLRRGGEVSRHGAYRSEGLSRLTGRPRRHHEPRAMSIRAASITASLFVFAAGCGGQVKRPDGGVGLLPVGASAPGVSATDGTGKVVRLWEMRGHPVVVYFYPKDETPGCTKEACAFRDAWTKYESAGVSIVGVSHDSEESHKAFRDHHHLPFPLVAD